MSKPTPAASVTIKRPPVPITSTALAGGLAPVLELLGLDPDAADDVVSMTITRGRIRVQLIPRHRGRAQHDALVRVSYPVVHIEVD